MTIPVTIIIPCRNEEGNLRRTVSSVRATAEKLEMDYELLLVDDGSTDSTFESMEALARDDPRVRAHKNEKNLGVGRTVMNAYDLIADGRWVTVVPGDNEIIFDSIANYLPLTKDADLILGYFGNAVIRTAVRRFASWAFARVIQIIYGYPYRYLNGLKLYRVEVFKGLDVVSTGHAFNAELIAKAQLRNPFVRVVEAPFFARGRSRGKSKAFRVSSMIRAVIDVIAGYRSVARYRQEVIAKDDPKSLGD